MERKENVERMLIKMYQLHSFDTDTQRNKKAIAAAVDYLKAFEPEIVGRAIREAVQESGEYAVAHGSTINLPRAPEIYARCKEIHEEMYPSDQPRMYADSDRNVREMLAKDESDREKLGVWDCKLGHLVPIDSEVINNPHYERNQEEV